MYHIFFTHSSVDGHLGCFHALAMDVFFRGMFIQVPYLLNCFIYFAIELYEFIYIYLDISLLTDPWFTKSKGHHMVV